MKSLSFLVALFLLVASASAQVENSLTPAEQAAGWKLLFDGKTLTGLRGVQKRDPLQAGWKIENGELTLPKDVDKMGRITGGDLMSAEAFTDFEFAFEWKVSVATNAGVRYLVRAGGSGSPAGCEYQIIDDVRHPEGLKGGAIRRTGALDGILPPVEEKRLHDAERWNASRIVVLGNHVEHWLNALKVVEFDLNSRALFDAVKEAKVKVPQGFGTKFKSPVVLLDQGDQISFRNLKIRPLLPASPATPVVQAPAITPAPPGPVARPVLPAATPIARPVAPLATPAPARPPTLPTLE